MYWLEWQLTEANKNESIHKLKWSKYKLYTLQGFWNYVFLFVCLFFPANYALFFGKLCGKKSQIMRIVHYFNLLSLEIFFAFTFNTKLSLLKAKTELNYIGVQAYSDLWGGGGSDLLAQKNHTMPKSVSVKIER